MTQPYVYLPVLVTSGLSFYSYDQMKQAKLTNLTKPFQSFIRKWPEVSIVRFDQPFTYLVKTPGSKIGPVKLKAAYAIGIKANAIQLKDRNLAIQFFDASQSAQFQHFGWHYLSLWLPNQ